MAEVGMFEKPIIATNFITAKEFISHGNDGLIANINSQSIYENVKRLLDDESLRKTMSENRRDKTTENQSEMTKFYEL